MEQIWPNHDMVYCQNSNNYLIINHYLEPKTPGGLAIIHQLMVSRWSSRHSFALIGWNLAWTVPGKFSAVIGQNSLTSEPAILRSQRSKESVV